MGTSRRLKLQEELASVLGSSNVYFQPPESIVMKYPCIVYEKKAIESLYADNSRYFQSQMYDVTVIDKDPDSSVVQSLLDHFKYIYYDRHYVVDNLNHDSLVISY